VAEAALAAGATPEIFGIMSVLEAILGRAKALCWMSNISGCVVGSLTDISPNEQIEIHYVVVVAAVLSLGVVPAYLAPKSGNLLTLNDFCA